MLAYELTLLFIRNLPLKSSGRLHIILVDHRAINGLKILLGLLLLRKVKLHDLCIFLFPTQLGLGHLLAPDDARRCVMLALTQFLVDTFAVHAPL